MRRAISHLFSSQALYIHVKAEPETEKCSWICKFKTGLVYQNEEKRRIFNEKTVSQRSLRNDRQGGILLYYGTREGDYYALTSQAPPLTQTAGLPRWTLFAELVRNQERSSVKRSVK